MDGPSTGFRIIADARPHVGSRSPANCSATVSGAFTRKMLCRS